MTGWECPWMFALLWYVCVLMAHESAAETEFVMPCFLVPEWRREERNGPRRGDLTRDFHFTSAYISHHSVRSFCLWTLPPRLCRDFLMTVPCLSRVNERNWRLVGVVNNLKSIKAVHVFYLVVVVVFLSSLLLRQRNLMVVCRSFGFECRHRQPFL